LTPRLTILFSDAAVIADLQALVASVALMLSDLSAERAAVVRLLNSATIPVVAIPLLPYEEGYYFTADNARRAAERYDEWKAWTAHHGLQWERVGLDIEPEARFYQQIMENPKGLLPLLLPRLRDQERPRRARAAYAALVELIHADDYRLKNYQFPVIADERRTGSTPLQRLFGLVDVRLARDLRLARHWCDDLLIQSLEGCVGRGFLTRLRSFDWGQAVAPPHTAPLAASMRGMLRALQRSSAHPWRALGVTVASAWLLSRPQRRASQPG